MDRPSGMFAVQINSAVASTGVVGRIVIINADERP
jgi:hypothetical protein